MAELDGTKQGQKSRRESAQVLLYSKLLSAKLAVADSHA